MMTMRSVRLFFALCALAVFTLPPAALRAGGALAPQRFFQQMEDIPLMPGLTELPDQSYIYDKPQGRIGEVHAYAGGVKAEDIRRYYRDSLPQFGWEPLSEAVWRRDSERMTLAVEDKDSGRFLKILIQPN